MAAVVFFSLLLIPHFVRSQITITASADTISMDGTVTISLTGTIPDFNSYAELPYSDGYIVVGNTTNYSYSSTNGNNVSLDQTFTLQPMRTGTFSVGPAWIQAGSKRIFSNKLEVTFNTTGGSIDNNGGVFMTCEPNIKKPYIGQEVTLSIRVYERADLDIEGSTQPVTNAMNGFFEVSGPYPMDHDYPDTVIMLHGNKWYGKTVYREFVFPNKLGKLTLPAYTFTCDVQENKYPTGDPFVDNMNAILTSVDLQSKPVTIEVLPLPTDNKPSIFNGDVGVFSMRSSMMDSVVHANDPAKFNFTLSGIGNFSLLQWPALNLPDGFTAYPATTDKTDDINSDYAGGTKSFNFTFVASKEGDYIIPPQQFAFYDTEKKRYRTLTTDSIPIHVLPALPDTAVVRNNLPKQFLTEEHHVALWIKILLIALPVLVLITLFILYRERKKKQQRLAEEAKQKELAEELNIPSGPTPWDNFRRAEEFYAYGNTGRCIAELYNCIRTACCLKGELGDDEASPSHIRYRLGTKKVDQPTIDEVLKLMDELSALRYNRSGLSVSVIGRYMTESKNMLTKLGF
ncbi:MAG TPA: BatD family protein [Bacteroidia bacterium]|nr:BatD family protein [Bacteroidia bacterium]